MKSTMLDRGREERRRRNFLPEIKARFGENKGFVYTELTCGKCSPSLVPVAGTVVEVKLDDGPEGIGNVCGVSVGPQPFGIGDKRSRAEGRTVSLRSAWDIGCE